MKRVLCSVLLVVILLTATFIPVSAATNYYTEDFPYNFHYTYSSYANFLPDATNGPIKVSYTRGVTTSAGHTQVQVPSGGTGMTQTGIFYHYDEGRRGDSNTVVNGWITSSAQLQIYVYATRVTHSGNRRVGEDFLAWDYAYTADNHGNPPV